MGTARVFPLFLRVAGLSILSFLLGITPALERSSAAGVAVGEPAPRLSMPLEGGGLFTLADEVQERLVLLEFVTPQCKPCLDSRPALENLLKSLRARDPVALVSVAIGTEQDLKLVPPPNPALGERRALGSDEMAQACGIFGTPVFLLVDRQGTVAWKHVGRLTPAGVDRALHTVMGDGRLAYVPPQGEEAKDPTPQKTR